MPDNADLREPARIQPPGLGLGERLRSARKARALSVTQVAESLRLEEASVVALEEGRFDAMGAAVFVRGHLKRYAQLVGLSEEQVLEAYRAAVPDSDAPPSLARPRQQADAAVRMGPWGLWLAAALLLAAVIIALSSRDREESAPSAAPAAVSDTPVPAASMRVPADAPPPVSSAAPPPATDVGAQPAGTATAPQQ